MLFQRTHQNQKHIYRRAIILIIRREGHRNPGVATFLSFLLRQSDWT